MEIRTASRQEKKERLLHFLETKREQRKAISRERKEAKSVLLAKKAIPFSRKEKRERLLQYLKERKEQLLATKKAKEDLRLEAIAKRKAFAEEKAAVKAKALTERKAARAELLTQVREIPKARALVSRAEKREKLLQFIRERKEVLSKAKEARQEIRLKALAKRKAFAEEKAVVKAKATAFRVKGIAKKVVPAKKTVAIIEAPPAERPKEEVKEAVKPVPEEAVKRKAVARKIELRVFLRRYGLRILFFLLFLAWVGEAFLFYSRVYLREEKSEEISVPVKKNFSPKMEKDEMKIAIRPELFEPAEVKIVGERDPFSDELFRMGVLVATERPKVIPFKSIVKPPEEEPIVIPPLIPEREKVSPLARVERPEVSRVSLPEKPSCPLRYRGTLEIAGIEYLFIEGEKPHQVTIGDIVEGYRLFNKIEDTIYLSKDGYIFQVRRESLLCPLHYRGRLIIDGKEYLFLEGKGTSRVALGETAEGYQVIKRTGNILYLLKDNNIFELKEE